LANSTWSNWVDSDDGPDAPKAVDIAFGAQPGWSTDDEGAKVDVYATPDGRLVILDADAPRDMFVLVAARVCWLCHDGATAAALPPRVACGACGRCAASDPIAAGILAVQPAPAKDTPAERRAWDRLGDAQRYPRPGRYVDRRPPARKPARARQPADDQSNRYLYRQPAARTG
jgi:hypothetical protein